MSTNEQPKVCAVLASDAPFFYQTRAAIESIRRAEGGADLDLRLITIGEFYRDQIQWLESARVTLCGAIDDIPRFNGAPAHTVALTCRPYLPEIFPDVEGIVWIDSDVRFVRPTGLMPWISAARNPDCPIAAAHESEPNYSINQLPKCASAYHKQTNARYLEVYGPSVALHFEFYKQFNAGLFAMPSRSPVWAQYRAHLQEALPFSYNRFREQDALNLAIAEVGVHAMLSTLNWLCSLSLPMKGPGGHWYTPDNSGRLIDVLHLSNSSEWAPFEGESRTGYEIYREMGLVE